MENNYEEIKLTPKNMYVPICVTQAISVVLILIAVVVIKFFFKSKFKKLEKWYAQNMLQETTITANFDEETTSEI